MVSIEQRMLKLSCGKRMPVRLDEPTWLAIDWLAQESGKSWTDWCNAVVDASTENGNLTATIRCAAMSGVLEATVFASSAAQSKRTGPIWESIAILDDARFYEALRQARVDGADNFLGFRLSAGVSEGQVCFFVEDKIKGGRNVVIKTPFTDNQWIRQATENQ